MTAFFLLLGSIFGMGLGYVITSKDILLSIILAILSLSIFLFAYRKKQVLSFLLSFTLFLLFAFVSFPLPIGKAEIKGIVIKTRENYCLIYSSFHRYYVYQEGNSFELGDILQISGEIKEYIRPNYESRFDFGEYLRSLGVKGEIEIEGYKSVFSNPFRLKAIENWFVGGLNENGKALVSSLLFADKDYDSSLLTLASSMNVVFALSSSGLIYGKILSEVNKRLGWKIKERNASLITFALSFILLPFGFNKVGIRRVFLSRFLFFLKEVTPLGKKGILSKENIVFISGLILAILNPYDLLKPGFLLGIGISIFFLYSSSFIYRIDLFKRKLVSLAFLFFLTLPLSFLYSEGEIPILSFLYIEILLPITFLATLACGGIFVFSFAKPLLNYVGDGYYYILKGLSYLNPKLSLPKASLVFVILYYAIFLIVTIFIEMRMKKIPLFISFISLGAYLASLLPFNIVFFDQISFINVGQGDSILIRDNNNVVLLDTGGNIGFDMAKEVLIPYFRGQGIDHIDYLIASHGDYDHIGAKESLMENFPVRHYLSTHDDFPLRIGSIALYSYNIYGEKQENDKSLVLSLSFMGKNWVFTGDAPSFVEKRIIEDNPDLPCDILKLGHHGSDTSTCEEFLDALTPEVGIISCGRNNSYGHPSQGVLNRLKERNIEIRRTDIEGTITYQYFSPIWL